MNIAPLGVRLTHHTLVRRSHEHRALHGVSRAWHAAGHTAVVAGAVVAGLRRRVCPPLSIDIAKLFTLSRSVPTFLPTDRERERKRFLIVRKLNFLCFQ